MIFSSEDPQLPIYRPLLPITISIILGISAGAWLPGHFVWVLATVLCIIMIWFIQMSNQPWSLVLPLLASVCCGYLLIQPWLAPKLPKHHIAHFADKGTWRIHGVVHRPPKMQRGRWQFELSAKRIVHEDGNHRVCGRVWVTGRGKWPGAKTGATVEFRGRLRSIRNFSNPGGFDYKRFMAIKGIHCRVYASAKSLKIITKAPPGGLVQYTEMLRHKLSVRMDHVLANYEADVLNFIKALILGDRSGISPTLRDEFNRAGVGHVMAISGLHVGMVATLSYVVSRSILAWIPLLLQLAWVQKSAAMVSLVPVLGYGILAGLSPSTQRAMLMVTVCLLGVWAGRRHDWLNTLAMAALVILIVYPPALLSISFQLSFSAVLALIAGAQHAPVLPSPKATEWWKKMGWRIMAFIWISTLAILGTMPLVLHYFNQISLIGLATNLVVVPLVGIFVVPAGLLGTLGALMGFETGMLLWHVAAWSGQLVLWTVQYAASWSWAAVKCVTPNGIEIGLFYLFGALVLFWKKWPYRTLILLVALILSGLDAGYWLYQRYGRNDLRVTAIDVGQAGASLLELPGGYTILVDGGGFSDNSMFDVGDAVIAPLLWHKKIATIDLVVLTHANSDHLNGLLYILRYFDVREVWSNHEPAKTKGYAQWLKLLAEGNIHHADFEQMPRRVHRNGVQLEILAPPVGFMDRTQDTWRDRNNNSLVLRVHFGDVSFLFTADIEKAGEADVLSRKGPNRLRSTVLFVPHHGSRSSSSMDFVKAVKPREAVISAGWQNRFKFPHKEVLQRYERVGSRVWCTAQTGALEIRTDGKTYQLLSHLIEIKDNY